MGQLDFTARKKSHNEEKGRQFLKIQNSKKKSTLINGILLDTVKEPYYCII